MKKEIILASASPRRKALLSSLLSNFGLKPVIIPSGIEEILPGKTNNPSRLACRLAEEKAEYVAKKKKGIIIGADTIVVHKSKILGKPSSKNEAKRMLMLLSGKYHEVFTGIFIMDVYSRKKFSTFERTKVKFRRLTLKEIDFYINTGSPFDKAGAYGIQDDFGSTFISGIEGDFFNVVGFPIVKTYLGLKKFIKL